jgi:hypothetical protein
MADLSALPDVHYVYFQVVVDPLQVLYGNCQVPAETFKAAVE